MTAERIAAKQSQQAIICFDGYCDHGLEGLNEVRGRREGRFDLCENYSGTGAGRDDDEVYETSIENGGGGGDGIEFDVCQDDGEPDTQEYDDGAGEDAGRAMRRTRIGTTTKTTGIWLPRRSKYDSTDIRGDHRPDCSRRRNPVLRPGSV